ncbi:kinase-like domain-containing protein, partial [Thelonectria olida]
MRDVMFEIEIMGRCDHPNLVKLRGILFEESGDGLVFPALLMEAADNRCPDLEAWCKGHAAPSSAVIGNLARGIAEGLDVLHSMGVVHADLKPSNVLMFRRGHDWQPKLADFGLSGISVSADAPRGGSRRWNAPECLPDAPPDLRAHSIQPCRDIYAFGLLFVYLLLQGCELFEKYDGDVDAVKLND